MIDAIQVQKYCCEDISLIENYEAAVNDTTQTWACHHRLEITDSGVIGMKELQARGLYYKRPAKELVFLTKSEHHSLHNKGERNSFYKKTWGENHPRGMKGRHHTEESRAKIGAVCKGLLWYNNGSTNIRAREGEQPDGFVRGILK